MSHYNGTGVSEPSDPGAQAEAMERFWKAFDTLSSTMHSDINMQHTRVLMIMLRPFPAMGKSSLVIPIQYNEWCWDLVHTAREVVDAQNTFPDTHEPRTTFVLGLGMAPCLYYIAALTQDSDIRRKAYSILLDALRREGLWSNDLAHHLVDIAIRTGRSEGKTLMTVEVEQSKSKLDVLSEKSQGN